MVASFYDTATASGWAALAHVDLTALTSTTWTPTDQGTSPTVDGVTFDINVLDANSATVGGGAGLASTDTTSDIYVRVPVSDLDDAPKYGRALAFVAVITDSGSQQGFWFGSAWSASWALLRTATGTIQVQRRTTSIASANVSIAQGITAVLLICSERCTMPYYRTDAIDPANPPGPNDDGWTPTTAVLQNTAPSWPFATTDDARVGFWQNGSAAFVLKAFKIWAGGS